MILSKNAQMEALGLVFIVFLLALGMFFMVSVSNKENEKSININPQNAKLEQDMVDAIKNINIKCPNSYIKKNIYLSVLIEDLVFKNSIHCDGKSSLVFTESILYNIFNATLVKWEKPFNFTIEKNGEIFINLGNPNFNCSMEDVGYKGFQAFPTSVGIVEMNLKICALV